VGCAIANSIISIEDLRALQHHMQASSYVDEGRALIAAGAAKADNSLTGRRRAGLTQRAA